MIKKISLIFIFTTTLFLWGIADAYFCDGYNERDSLCSTWNIIESIDNLQNFNSSYQNNINGYFWSNYIDTFSQKLESEFIWYIWNKYNFTISPELWSSIGFLGTNRTSKTPINSIAPLGFMKNFNNNSLVYDNQIEENNFSGYPLIIYELEDQENNQLNSSNANSLSVCNSPKSIINTNIEIKNNWLLDYIHISWDNPWKEKVKIIKISPINKEFLIDDWVNYLDDYDTKVWYYSYFIATYNDCNKRWLYSDLIKINYLWKDFSSKLYLSILKNELTLNIPNTIEIDNSIKIKLECKNSLGIFINDFLVNNKYVFDNDILKKYFTCESSFFDKNWVFQKSELFINKPFLDSYIREKQALDYVYKWDSTNQIYNLLYLNSTKFDSWAYLKYGKSSLYLVNILAKTYITSEELSFDALKNLWYIWWTDISFQTRITEEDFINLLVFIEKDLNKFQKNIYTYVNENYWDKKYNLVLDDINQNIILIKKLKEFEKIDKQKYDNLLECISKVRCKDINLLDWIDTIWLKQEIDINTYKNYMKILYHNLWYETYKQSFYSLDQYNKFIDILVESVSYENSFYDNKINYESFRNLQYEILLHLNLQKNISYLVGKYLEKIILIYDTTKKEDLIWILRDFLNK